MGIWSSGMILLSGGRGPGFNSRNAPRIFAQHLPPPGLCLVTVPLQLIASIDKEVKKKSLIFTLPFIT
jgi:hypothetical protein